MEIHWIKLTSLDILPKDRPFLIAINENVSVCAFSLGKFWYIPTSKEISGQLEEKDIINNDHAYWMDFPKAPSRDRLAHYLKYR